jgi:hypothetical protein
MRCDSPGFAAFLCPVICLKSIKRILPSQFGSLMHADEMLIQTSRSHRRHALEMQATLTGGIIGAMIIPRISIFRKRQKSHNFR